MATSSGSPPKDGLSWSQTLPSVQDDDILWTEYLRVASDVDTRLVKEWTSVLDAVLVFVALFSGVLTAFIIQISDKFQPAPAEVTNKILIAIYNRTMNASAPIDLEQFLRLDEGSRSYNIYQSWLLYTSLTISILVAALAMAAKLWVVRYSREVTTSGAPRTRARRRQEVYDGLLTWKMESYIDAMPLLALSAVLLFVFFIHASVPVRQAGIAYFVSVILNIGFAFIVISSFSAAFIPDSPFRSPFSDFVGFIPTIIPDKSVPIIFPNQPAIHWRTVCNFLTSIPFLAAGGYYLVKGNSASFPCIYWAVGGLFALMREAREKDIPPRLFSFPGFIFLSSIIVLLCFMLSLYYTQRHSTPLCIAFFALGCFCLVVMGYFGLKMSKTRPKTVEVEAVSWLLKTSTNQDPVWFQKAVHIAGDSTNSRALLVEKLLPLLQPLITSVPDHGLGSITHEQEAYIVTLAVLMDFRRQERSFMSNAASLERPELPTELIDRLEQLKKERKKCDHKVDKNQKWKDGLRRCPKACVSDAVDHLILQNDTVRTEVPRRYGNTLLSLMLLARDA